MNNDRKLPDPDQTYVWATDWNQLRASLRHQSSQDRGNRNPIDATVAANLDQAPRLYQSIQFDVHAMVNANLDHTTRVAERELAIESLAQPPLPPANESDDIPYSIDAQSIDSFFAELDFVSTASSTNRSTSVASRSDVEINLDLELGLLETVQEVSRAMSRTKPRRVRIISRDT